MTPQTVNEELADKLITMEQVLADHRGLGTAYVEYQHKIQATGGNPDPSRDLDLQSGLRRADQGKGGAEQGPRAGARHGPQNTARGTGGPGSPMRKGPLAVGRIVWAFLGAMATLLGEAGAAGISHQGPGVEGLLGCAGSALWTRISDLRLEVLGCTGDGPLTEGGAEQGFWTDATGHVKRLAQEAFREDDLLKPRRWSVYLDITGR